MKATKVRRNSVILLLALVAFLVVGGRVEAGDLEPNSPPGPTMKTLDEVEPRIPIAGSMTPIGDYIIAKPGSYYLTGERHFSGYGIRIQCDNVTVDLMGHSLVGPGVGGGGYSGFYIVAQSNIEIRNGTIREFGYAGIYEANANGKNHRIINVRVVANDDRGLHLKGTGHLVKNCTASYNQGYGIHLEGSGHTVIDNMASGNGTFGINAGSGCTVTGNTCVNNTGDGISVGSMAMVIRNTCVGNGADNGDGAGIHSNGAGNRIEANNVSGNDRGIDVDSAGNLIVKNSASGNTGTGSPSANYDIAGGNHYGAIISSPGGGFMSSSPWANFEF